MTPDLSRENPYLIAEIGVNHDGSAERAADLLRACRRAGFDAVKFQYWIVDELLADTAPTAPYQGTGDQHDLLAALRLDIPVLRELRALARSEGIDFIVTPDGERACHDIATLDLDALKIGSGDANNPWLVETVAREAVARRIPVIASTGMLSDEEVRAMSVILGDVERVVVLHCVTAYPTPVASANLGRLSRLASITGRPIGFSDHTVGLLAATAAVSLGAVAVEKHVTWSTAAKGPDHAASLPIEDAAAWAAALRAVAHAVHTSEGLEEEAVNRAVVCKGLYAARSLEAGAVLGRDDLLPLRPAGTAIPAGDRDAVLGRHLLRAVEARRPLTWDDVDAR